MKSRKIKEGLLIWILTQKPDACKGAGNHDVSGLGLVWMSEAYKTNFVFSFPVSHFEDIKLCNIPNDWCSTYQ